MTLTQGDCVEAMRSMPEDSVDAVVTDPPYGIRMMGLAWDGVDIERAAKESQAHRDVTPLGEHPKRKQVGTKTIGSAAAKAGQYDLSLSANQQYQEWCTEWARECLRVLKPGGYLLASGGTRTYHRLACAIEDAGFEIRDSITWLYGSGFPKSLDVSKAIDKMRDDRRENQQVQQFLNEARLRAGKTLKQVNQHFGFATNGSNNAGDWMTNPRARLVPSWEQWLELKAFLGFSNELDAEAWRLNGRKGKPGEAWDEREVVGKHLSPLTKSDTGRYQWNTNGEGRTETDLTAPATEAAKQWEGFGTALKPAHEPIVVARKPLSEKTVARQVLSTGTGALNIDGSRLSTSECLSQGASDLGYHGVKEPVKTAQHNDGRWPANVVLSHSPECRCVGVKRVRGTKAGTYEGSARGFNPSGKGVYKNSQGVEEGTGYADPDGFETTEAWECVDVCPVAELDRQSGLVRSSGHTRSSEGFSESDLSMSSGKRFAMPGVNTYSDKGGASRFFKTFEGEPGFFYCAKSSRRERNSFTKSLPRTKNKRKRYQQDRSGRWFKRVSNTHPTVKPRKLLSYLVKLVTPPGGVVLDPFAGSGSTLVAAIQEGFEAVGIEQDASYIEIAERRVAHARAEIESQPLVLEV